ncbi:hypothetical protein [Arthrobacter sp. ISL-65]|uniref:hypothetical protein n=1 Tax=Arthrobacter sp. ISL-65 TaxID=2819112 RepID=UPI002034E451|nr:hypothetical protein [Arthrobacter sp. ISL-65]
MDSAVPGRPPQAAERARTDADRPRLSLLKEPDADTAGAHLRWTPAQVVPEAARAQ